MPLLRRKQVESTQFRDLLGNYVYEFMGKTSMASMAATFVHGRVDENQARSILLAMSLLPEFIEFGSERVIPAFTTWLETMRPEKLEVLDELLHKEDAGTNHSE